VKCDDLEEAIRITTQRNLDLGHIEAMSRALPSGEQLAWRLTRGSEPGDGLVPFLIDWGKTPHPALSSPSGCTLRSLRAEHPDPVRIREYLGLLGLQDVLEVSEGSEPRLSVGLSTPKGDVVLE
jgi:hypothetical protein